MRGGSHHDAEVRWRWGRLARKRRRQLLARKATCCAAPGGWQAGAPVFVFGPLFAIDSTPCGGGSRGEPGERKPSDTATATRCKRPRHGPPPKTRRPVVLQLEPARIVVPRPPVDAGTRGARLIDEPVQDAVKRGPHERKRPTRSVAALLPRAERAEVLSRAWGVGHEQHELDLRSGARRERLRGRWEAGGAVGSGVFGKRALPAGFPWISTSR